MRKQIVLGLLLAANFVFCYANSLRNTGTRSWINVEYIECLESGLPCECEKNISGYYSIELDTSDLNSFRAISLRGFGKNEPDLYSLKKSQHLEFEAIKLDPRQSEIRLIFSGDSLFLKYNNIQGKFVNLPKGQFENSEDPYELANVLLLNDQFVKRKRPSLVRILKEDELRCHCDHWLTDVNFLFVKGALKSWILELSGDYLLIKEITNVDREPDDPITTKKVARYKWK